MKSIIKQIQFDQVSQKLADVFTEAETVARRTGFVQRRSPLTGLMFLQALVVGFLRDPRASLNQLAQECAQLGFAISPQGLHERIHERSEAFLEAIYQQALEQLKSQIALPLSILTQFSQLLLVDSTFDQLPASLKDRFPGSGGKASCASLKVQLVYEFISGNLSELCLQAGRAADQAYTQYLELVQAGGLVILDLGYFCLTSFHAIAQKGAYFLVRYHYPTALYTPDGPRLDLLSLLCAQGQAPLDCLIQLGARSRPSLACRLIAVPVPLAVAEERRRKARRKAATHGKTLTAPYLQSLSWSIFVTNVPAERLTTQQVIAFYRIRWQIELIFKFWKSYCGLDHLPGVRPARVMTEFYTKLLVAVLSNFLIAPIRLPVADAPQHEISPFQVRKILADFGRDLVTKLFDRPALHQVLVRLYSRIARYGFKQIRRKKPNVLASLDRLSFQGAAS
jgi:Transposase DDE domain